MDLTRRGWGGFVDLKKGEFIGREAALKEKENGGALRLVSFAVDAANCRLLGR